LRPAMIFSRIRGPGIITWSALSGVAVRRSSQRGVAVGVGSSRPARLHGRRALTPPALENAAPPRRSAPSTAFNVVGLAANLASIRTIVPGATLARFANSRTLQRRSARAIRTCSADIGIDTPFLLTCCINC
jgi:hypothetical protein